MELSPVYGRAHYIKLARVALKLARAWIEGKNGRHAWPEETRRRFINGHLRCTVEYRLAARAATH